MHQCTMCSEDIVGWTVTTGIEQHCPSNMTQARLVTLLHPFLERVLLREETNFAQSRFGHPDLTNFGQSNFGQPIFGQSNFGQSNFGQYIFGSGVCHGGAPKGEALKGGALKGGAPKGGGPKIRALFSVSRPHVRSFCLSLGVFFVVFWWCLEVPGPSNVHVWSSRVVV